MIGGLAVQPMSISYAMWLNWKDSLQNRPYSRNSIYFIVPLMTNIVKKLISLPYFLV